VCLFLITAALIAAMTGCTGDGPTPSQNLEIRTWYDLGDVRDNLAGHHVLMNDLNSSTAGYDELAGPAANNGTGWDPIGTTAENDRFVGSFDGQGYEIRDLFINRPDESRVGLFCFVYEGGVIKNLGLTNVTVICRGISGGLVGQSYGTVSNSYFSGNVTGDAYVGGLIGPNFGTLEDCYVTGNVTGGVYSGGLIGANMGTVSKCYSTGSVTGSQGVGGLVGQNGMVAGINDQYAGAVSNSYSTGSVAGSEGVGGLVGFNTYGSVSNSYSTGGVSGNSSVGGLVGGSYGGTVNSSFWDTETSGQSISDGGTGKTTAEMQDIATFSGAGWNIIPVVNSATRNPAYIWNIVDDVAYPFLSWQPT
jgi:hypothetical protein